MATWQNIGGTWKSGVWWQNVFGTWRQCQMWQNVGGIWKQLSTQFTPDGGNTNDTASGSVSRTLSCNTPAVWTYTLAGSISASITSGSTANSITFTTVQGGSPSAPVTRSGSANVTGVSNGVSRSFTVVLTAEAATV